MSKDGTVIQPTKIFIGRLFLPSTVLTVSGSRGLPFECGLQIAEFGLINPQSEIPNRKFTGTLSLLAPPKAAQVFKLTAEF